MATERKQIFLYESAEDGVWLRARALVKSIDKACNRLGDHDDKEALHDFRIALQKLCTFIRGYHDCLPVGKKYRKALRSLTRSTGEVRNLEVLVELLEKEKKLPALANNTAIDLLLGKLAAKLNTLYEPLRILEVQRWTSLRKALHPHIDTIGLKPESGFSFLDVTQDRIIAHTDTLEQELAGLQSSHDDHLPHDTRVTGERLRYLIEPLSRDMSRAVDIVAELKVVQDALGDYHDAFVLLQYIESSAHDICGEYARQKVRQEIVGSNSSLTRDPLPAFVQLVQTIKSQRTQLWERFYQRYVIDRDRLISIIRTFAAELDAAPATEPQDSSTNATIVEIDRYRKIP